MSVEKLQAIAYVLFLILATVVLVYLISKYFFTKLLANLEPCQLYVHNFGNQNEVIFAIKLGERLGQPVMLTRVHQTSAYLLPFFALVVEFDPDMMDENIIKTYLVKKLVLIEDTKGNLKVYTQKVPA